MVRLVSWNVNGIRAAIKKGFFDFVENDNPDVICLQETKAHPEQVDLTLPRYYHYWNSAEKKGYSGTAVFSKTEPIRVSKGFGVEKHDQEGRLLTLEFEGFYLVNVYTPNAQRELTRLDYKTREWDVLFLEYVKDLEKDKPVVFCGDLNVAHKEIDLANPKSNVKNAGFTAEERQSFDRIIDAGFIDTLREFHEGPGHYTWWTYRANARARNIGWRIDYFCISTALKSCLKKAEILPDVMGSDHCPIAIELDGVPC